MLFLDPFGDCFWDPNQAEVIRWARAVVCFHAQAWLNRCSVGRSVGWCGGGCVNRLVGSLAPTLANFSARHCFFSYAFCDSAALWGVARRNRATRRPHFSPQFIEVAYVSNSPRPKDGMTLWRLLLSARPQVAGWWVGKTRLVGPILRWQMKHFTSKQGLRISRCHVGAFRSELRVWLGAMERVAGR